MHTAPCVVGYDGTLGGPSRLWRDEVSEVTKKNFRHHQWIFSISISRGKSNTESTMMKLFLDSPGVFHSMSTDCPLLLSNPQSSRIEVCACRLPMSSN